MYFPFISMDLTPLSLSPRRRRPDPAERGAARGAQGVRVLPAREAVAPRPGGAARLPPAAGARGAAAMGRPRPPTGTRLVWVCVWGGGRVWVCDLRTMCTCANKRRVNFKVESKFTPVRTHSQCASNSTSRVRDNRNSGQIVESFL